MKGMKKKGILIISALAILVFTPLVNSIEIESPVEGSYLSGETELSINLNQTDIDRLEFYWASKQTGEINELGSLEVGEEKNYSFIFDSSKLPESNEILLFVDAVNCYSQFLCRNSESKAVEVGVDKTDPKIMNPWLSIDNFGGEDIEISLRVMFTGDLSGIEDINYPMSKEGRSKYTLNLTDALNESFSEEEINIEFEDGAGNEGYYELNYKIIDEGLEFKSGDESKQTYYRKGEIVNLGENLLNYDVSNHHLNNSQLIERSGVIGELYPKDSKGFKAVWRGNWIDESSSAWTQVEDKTSIVDETYFEREVNLKASEDLPSKLEFTYTSNENGLSNCNEINIGSTDVSLNSGESINLTINSSARCIDIGSIGFEEKVLDGEEVILVRYEDVENNFHSGLEVYYELKDIPEGFECEEECILKINGSSDDLNDFNFTLVNSDEKNHLNEELDEHLGITGYFSGGLDNGVFKLFLSLFLTTLIVIIAYILKKKNYFNREEEYPLGE